LDYFHIKLNNPPKRNPPYDEKKIKIWNDAGEEYDEDGNAF